MARVDLEGIEKIYPNGGRGVVGIDLAIADAELMVLVGPSGCGKSTLLRIIAGLEQPTGGLLKIGGTVVNDLSPQARNVAMVFQDYALYPQMTVRGNLEFPLRMRGMARTEIDRRVAWAAGVLGLDGTLDRLPKQLSGGQRQRVAMGRALVREPAVSLLDEPLSNLDAKLRVQVRAEIGELQERLKTTMIYVTHDQVEAMTLGHRVAVLNAGRLEQVAAPEELYARPATAFVAGFIGNPPMNLFPTRAAGGGGPTIALGPATVAVAGPRAAAVGRAASAGIRPEAFRLADAAASGAVPVVVDHVEWLGHETLAYVRARGPAPAAGAGASASAASPFADDAGAPEGVHLIARLPGMQRLAPGQVLALTADPEAVHLFDADGRTLG